MIMGKKSLYFITDEDETGIELALENKENDITICLLQDAVFFANKTNKLISEALNQNKTVIVVKEDIEKRGLTNIINNKVNALDYGEIIDKIFEHDSVINL